MTETATDWTAPFRREGRTGEAVVLFHGYTGHPGHCTPLGEALAEAGHTVVAPRLAGHTGNAEDMADVTWRDWMSSARSAAESVSEHRRVHLVGLSMGGLLAILLARPLAAASITTVNAPILVRDTRMYLAPLARHFVEWVPAADIVVPDSQLDHLWAPTPLHSTAAVAGLVAVVRHAWRAAGRLRRPSLVIQSRVDEAVRPVSGRLLAWRLGGHLVWVDTRHNAFLDPGRPLVHDAVLSHITRLTVVGPERELLA
jgi:carboxylesterase